MIVLPIHATTEGGALTKKTASSVNVYQVLLGSNVKLIKTNVYLTLAIRAQHVWIK